MSDPPETQSPRWRRWTFGTVKVMLIVAAFGVVTAFVVDRVHLSSVRRSLTAENREARLEALNEVIDRRESRVAEEVLDILRQSEDREVLAAGAHAAARIDEARATEILQARVNEGPADLTAARMMVYAAQIADRDVRMIPWYEAALAYDEPWRQAGAALGLLKLGDPAGGAAVIEMAPHWPIPVRQFALPEFRRIAARMSEAVGRPLDWSGSDEGQMSDAQWQALQRFWSGHATATLTNDVLNRLERFDRKWAEVGRLLHARQKMARWFE